MTEAQYLNLPILIASGILIANGTAFLIRGSTTRYYRTKSTFWLLAAALSVALAVGLVGSTFLAILTFK